ncbi:MAG: nitrogen regulation protein NR(II) [Burkholderiales bacterium]|jgi:two-component system nitrogen regulation sensor histidine kinase GlnL
MQSDGRKAAFAGLDLLACAVLVVAPDSRILFANTALEDLWSLSRRNLLGLTLAEAFPANPLLDQLLLQARQRSFDNKRLDLTLDFLHREALQLHATIVALEEPGLAALFEFREIEQQLKFDREARFIEQGQASRELIRNLAHEIKNPLGGIRGAAQLLELEIVDDKRAQELREYTQVMIKEADRLQSLVDRLLAPHRRPQMVAAINVHEVCERVRSVLLAEFPAGLEIERDYDTSLPDFTGDKEQLIQALLNIAHNAAQALAEQIECGTAKITLRTRIARNITLVRERTRLALDLHVIDNGPGVPEELRDRIFFPLVSGRPGGSGLGLSLAQTFIQQHRGTIECSSKPGYTDFRILLPLA